MLKIHKVCYDWRFWHFIMSFLYILLLFVIHRNSACELETCMLSLKCTYEIKGAVKLTLKVNKLKNNYDLLHFSLCTKCNENVKENISLKMLKKIDYFNNWYSGVKCWSVEMYTRAQ